MGGSEIRKARQVRHQLQKPSRDGIDALQHAAVGDPLAEPSGEIDERHRAAQHYAPDTEVIECTERKQWRLVSADGCIASAVPGIAQALLGLEAVSRQGSGAHGASMSTGALAVFAAVHNVLPAQCQAARME